MPLLILIWYHTTYAILTFIIVTREFGCNMTCRVRIKWDRVDRDSKAQIYDDDSHYGTLVMYDHKDIKYKINMYWICDCHNSEKFVRYYNFDIIY